MQLSAQDLTALWITFKLAAVSTAILIVLCTPLAWWLAHTRWRGKTLVEAVVALPLVLPPTVLGFYLLLLLGPRGAVGRFFEDLGLGHLAFTFTGLVIGSMIYSLPSAPRSTTQMDNLSSCFNWLAKIRPVHQLFKKMDLSVA